METFKSEADIRAISQMSPVVLIDIFTQWCSPCRAISAILDDLEKEYDGKVKFVKVDVSDGPPQWIIDMRISSVPTLIYLRNGEIMKVETGWKDKKMISDTLNNLL